MASKRPDMYKKSSGNHTKTGWGITRDANSWMTLTLWRKPGFSQAVTFQDDCRTCLWISESRKAPQLIKEIGRECPSFQVQ